MALLTWITISFDHSDRCPRRAAARARAAGGAARDHHRRDRSGHDVGRNAQGHEAVSGLALSTGVQIASCSATDLKGRVACGADHERWSRDGEVHDADLPRGGDRDEQAERERTLLAIVELNRSLREQGILVDVRLRSVETASSVRVREGKTQITDGPFAVTKEFLAGYYILDCADLMMSRSPWNFAVAVR
jgi:hypothetical protein